MSWWDRFLAWLEKVFGGNVVVIPEPEPPEPPTKPDPIKPPSGNPDRGTAEWYASLLERCKIREDKSATVRAAANLVYSGKERYLMVARTIGCPAWLIGAWHNLESGCDFRGCLHNGERIIGTGRVTTLVPAGRGPFKVWEESGLDALKGFKGMSDWSPGMCMKRSEAFNGMGYFKRGIPSPYVWSMTTEYVRGKYVADGVFDAMAVSKQVGVAAIYKDLEARGMLF